MAKGLSLHIGVNRFDPAHYGGTDGKLNACEADARSMEEIARGKGFRTKTILTTEATRGATISFLKDATQELKSGDILFLSYSGHGGQVPDLNNDEPDFQDETWCLFDGQLLDDELHDLYAQLAAGVRVLVISDSCHSGTVTKMLFHRELAAAPAAVKDMMSAGEGSEDRDRLTAKALPSDVALRTYQQNKAFYDEIGKALKPKAETGVDLKASVRLISGCQDNQYSYDGTFNGAFTAALLKTWFGGRFKGNYGAFHSKILDLLPPYQSPNHFVIGPTSPSFDEEKPFTI